jgi:hypothetical protein
MDHRRAVDGLQFLWNSAIASRLTAPDPPHVQPASSHDDERSNTQAHRFTDKGTSVRAAACCRPRLAGYTEYGRCDWHEWSP